MSFSYKHAFERYRERYYLSADYSHFLCLVNLLKSGQYEKNKSKIQCGPGRWAADVYDSKLKIYVCFVTDDHLGIFTVLPPGSSHQTRLERKKNYNYMTARMNKRKQR